MEIFLLVLIIGYSIILHEIAHGYVAYRLGDPTAKLEGRLTLNPVSHIDPIGTVLVPAIFYYLSGFLFGWAKPVPYNPFNLRNYPRDSVLIALAGPATNILLALIFAFLYNIFPLHLFLLGLRINLVLAFFNLLPIPPLDGSKILLSKLSIERYQSLEMIGFLLVIVFIYAFWGYFSQFIKLIQNFLVGG
ncbi:MAG: site-2 protease family protein [Patescibacteria group bacterium]|nr:site-2 protease family protein [Patescibacteria group bacterium]